LTSSCPSAQRRRNRGLAYAVAGVCRLPGYPSRHPLNLLRVWRELEPTLFR
jgi:hypothetical protein